MWHVLAVAAPAVPTTTAVEAVGVRLADLALRAAGATVVLLIAWVLAGAARRAIRRNLDKTPLDRTLGKFLSNVIRWVVVGVALVATLNLFGVEPTSFAALVGAAGLAIGLAFQGSLSNLAAGLMLLLFRPFKFGDFVNVAGQMGTVNEIDIFQTELDTPDGRRVIVPNGQIFGNIIENLTHHPRRRVDVLVGVAYAADIDATRAALEGAVQGVPGSLEDPPREVVLDKLGASSVDWRVSVWCKRESMGVVKQAMTRAVKNALGEAGIGIPYPQLDVHLDAAGGIVLRGERAGRGSGQSAALEAARGGPGS